MMTIVLMIVEYVVDYDQQWMMADEGITVKSICIVAVEFFSIHTYVYKNE